MSMNNFFKKQPFIIHAAGLIASLYRLPFFFYQYHQFNKDNKKLRLSDVFPQLFDSAKGHSFDDHYIYHTSWAARVVKKISPKKHIDISSSLYFSGIISAFLPVEFHDYRPANLVLKNLSVKTNDLTSLNFPDKSIASLSCMHTLEHIGLGRYGDPIDSAGDKKAMKELRRVVKKGGSLIIVVPVGRPRVMFNAHRIYSYQQIISEFKSMKLQEFSLLPDDSSSGIVENANPKLVSHQDYGCGMFWFKQN